MIGSNATVVGLTVEVSIAGTKNVIGGVQSILPCLFARVELLDGLQKQTEAVIRQPLPAPHTFTSDPAQKTSKALV